MASITTECPIQFFNRTMAILQLIVLCLISKDEDRYLFLLEEMGLQININIQYQSYEMTSVESQIFH